MTRAHHPMIVNVTVVPWGKTGLETGIGAGGPIQQGGTMAAYIIFEVDVKDPERYARNRDLIRPTLEPYGGRFLVRGGNVDTLEGSWKPSRLVVVEFPNVEKAKQWWKSEEYRPAKQLRQETTHTEMILAEGI